MQSSERVLPRELCAQPSHPAPCHPPALSAPALTAATHPGGEGFALSQPLLAANARLCAAEHAIILPFKCTGWIHAHTG